MLSITTSQGVSLDLYPDTTLSIEENSPMFTNIGSYSMPLSLPPTPGNLAALNFPDRYQRRHKFSKTMRVTISCGAYIRQASMHIDSATHGSAISATLYLRESNFYERIKNKQLLDIFKDKGMAEFKDGNTNIGWYNYMNKVMCGDISTDFHVFPVLLQKEDVSKDESEGSVNLHLFWQQFTIANAIVYGKEGNSFGGSTRNDKSGNAYYELAHQITLTDSEGIEYSSPAGYGVAPYLKLTFVLRQVLVYFGYELQTSVLDTDVSFKSLCILHPTIDALVNGNINYSQLLPDVDVDTFLQMIENSFGLRFVIDERFSTITPRFWKDVLTQPSIFDLTPLSHDWPQVAYHGNKNIKLTINRKSDESLPLVFDTMQQLTEKYGAYCGAVANTVQLQVLTTLPSPALGVYLVCSNRSFYRLYSTGTQIKTEVIDRYVQDFYPPGSDIPLEHFNTGFTLCPLVNTPMAGKTHTQYNVTATGLALNVIDWYKEALDSIYGSDDGLIAAIPFVDNLQYLNTVLQTTTAETDGSTTSTFGEESDASAPIYLAFAHGRALATTAYPDLSKTFFSSQDAYLNNGIERGTFDLMPFSLYNNFWQKYDTLLNSSFHEL